MVLPDLLPYRSRQLSIRGVSEAHPVVAAYDPHFGELVRVWNGQAAQPNGIEQLKDRRIRADSQGQREDANQRESRTSAQQAGAVAQVPPDALDPSEAIHAANPLSATWCPKGCHLFVTQRHHRIDL